MNNSSTANGDWSQPGSVTEILERTEASVDDDNITVRKLVEGLGEASFAPLLALPALIVVTPASGIPFLSSLCGISIALIAAQMLFRRDHVWLPDWIMRKEIGRDALCRAIGFLHRPAGWIDKVTSRRLSFFFHRPLVYLPQIICILAGIAMPVLELVPFSSSILGVTVSILAIAMVTRDGLLVLFGLATISGTVLAGYSFLS